MADFGSWWIFEFKISLGELANALAVIGIGLYVANVIERRTASKRAAKDIIADLCGESLDQLAALSDILEAECKPGGAVTAEAKMKISRSLRRFSNSIHSIEVATRKASLSKAEKAVEALKGHREVLRAQIMEPLATAPTIDATGMGQIESVLLKAREALIEFELTAHQS